MKPSSRALWLALLTLQLPLAAGAEPTGQRWALLIGVNDYANLSKLEYSAADMGALKERLTNSGFPEEQVFLIQSGSQEGKYQPFKSNIKKQLDLVLGLAEPDDLVVVAFSGHGLYLDGKRYLCPADADMDQLDTLLPVDDVYQALQRSNASLKLMIVDACRNDPRPPGRKSASPKLDLEELGKGFEKPPEGVVVLSSCAAGEISMEDKKFGHGVFLHFLMEGLDGAADADTDGAVSIGEAADYAGQKTKIFVARTYNDSQRPFITGSLSTDVLRYSFASKRGLKPRLTNTLGMELVLIQAGSFEMGSEGVNVPVDETPRHQVQITRPFYLGKYEVTQGAWSAQMKTKPWQGKVGVLDDPNCPASYVSWEEASSFCEHITTAERQAGRVPVGWRYALPTEAQWEYACRAGSTTTYSFGDDKEQLGLHAWLAADTRDADEEYPHPVGKKPANVWGLHDMYGNVWEWCQDWYGEDYYAASARSDPEGPALGSFRVRRGGGWYDSARYCWSAKRYGLVPSLGTPDVGFRVALIPSGP